MARTAKEVRDKLKANGMIVRQWAKQHGFPENTVRAVIYSKNKGNYGKSHKVAVALGIKDAPK